MQSKKSVSALAALPGLILLGACGTDLGAPSEAEQQINLDVATYAADATTDDVVLMTASADETMQPGFPSQVGCSRVGLFRHRCPTRHFGDDVNYSRDVTYFDGTGAEMEYFDRDSTASVNVVATFDGTRTKEDRSVTVSRESDMTVSGLLGAETERTWNGTSSASRNRTHYTDDGGERVYDMSSSSHVEEVVFAVPRHGTWPLSGTITRNVSVQIVSGAEDPTSRTRTVVINFNGTQFATITVNGETFTLDLETKTVDRDEEA